MEVLLLSIVTHAQEANTVMMHKQNACALKINIGMAKYVCNVVITIIGMSMKTNVCVLQDNIGMSKFKIVYVMKFQSGMKIIQTVSVLETSIGMTGKLNVSVMKDSFGVKSIKIAFSIVTYALEANTAIMIRMDVCALKTNTGITQNV